MTTNLEHQYGIVQRTAREHTIGELATIMLFLKMLHRRNCKLDINRIKAMIQEDVITRVK